MAAGGVDSKEYLEFMARDSINVDDSGFFSIQVISAALATLDITLDVLTSPHAKDARERPDLQEAFICNHAQHWLTLRKISGKWWNLNSTLDCPKRMGDMYLSAFLQQLESEQYTVFVVRGTLPLAAAASSPFSSSMIHSDPDLARAIAAILEDKAVTESVAAAPPEEQAMPPPSPPPFTVDEFLPTTRVQVRLANGECVVQVFNHCQTVGDLRRFVAGIAGGGTFKLVTRFPRRDLTDGNETIESAGLLNSSVLQQIV